MGFFTRDVVLAVVVTVFFISVLMQTISQMTSVKVDTAVSRVMRDFQLSIERMAIAEKKREEFMKELGGGESTSTETTTSGGGYKYRSHLAAVAPMIFPIHPETGKIDFPKDVEYILIDIGAREPSHYLNMVTKMKDPKIGLIMFDPLYDSYVPIAKRALEYTMQDSDPLGDWIESENTRKRVFAVNAAIGPKEEQVEFQISESAHCGSILPDHLRKENPDGSKGCPYRKGVAQAMIFTLQDVIALIPDGPELHVKIDTEGAEMLIMKSAGSSMKRATTIFAECDPDVAMNPDVEKQMKELMCDFGFCGHYYEAKDQIFWQKLNPSVPKFLTNNFPEPSGMFEKMYNKVQPERLSSP